MAKTLAARAKPTSEKVKANGKRKESSSEESDSSEETFSPIKLTQSASAKKITNFSSDSSSSEDSDGKRKVSASEKTTPVAVRKAAVSLDDSSDASSSEESLSDDDDTGKKANISAPAKTTSVAVQNASSSDESSSEDSDTSGRGKVSAPVKITRAGAQKTADSSDSSSDASSSEESSSEDSGSDQEMASVPTKSSPNKGGKTSDPKDELSDTSSSEESESSEEEEDETPNPTTPIEANKKRKADSVTAGAPKKVKLANVSASAVTSAEETKSIFVGRLSWNVDKDWLAEEFAECGEVESAHVQMDRNTGRSRGFGYVHFKNADAVEKALALNGKEIDGRAINIDKSSPPDKKASTERRAQTFGDKPSPPSAVLFIGNLSFGVNEDTLWETFGEHGDIKSVRVPTDRDTGKPKGFAYVEFSEVGAAKRAHEALQGFEFDGRSIRLDFSQPRDSAAGRGGAQRGRGGRGRGGFSGDHGRGGGRGGRGGDRGGRGRGRGARTGGITKFEGQKITFD